MIIFIFKKMNFLGFFCFVCFCFFAVLLVCVEHEKAQQSDENNDKRAGKKHTQNMGGVGGRRMSPNSKYAKNTPASEL